MELRVSVDNLWDFRYAMLSGANELKKVCDAILRKYVEAASSIASRLAPKRTGRLSSSIKWVREGELNYLIGSQLNYAPYIEFGTKPHIIRPRAAKALLFRAGSSTYFAKSAKHPGFRERPFLRPAISEVEPKLMAEMASKAEDLFKLKFKFR
ncbi:MAG: HK97 gp10 family phage protein [Nitrososphaerales archaeon]